MKQTSPNKPSPKQQKKEPPEKRSERRKQKQKVKKKEEFYYLGFTLLELLVVIAIVGVLASVVLASLSASREKARDAKRIAQLEEINKALQLYYSDNGEYLTYEDWSTLDYAVLPESPLNEIFSVTQAHAYADNGDFCKAYGSDTDNYLEVVLDAYINPSAKAPDSGELENQNYFYSVSDDQQEYCLGIELENAANVPNTGNTSCVSDTPLGFEFDAGEGYAIGNYDGNKAATQIMVCTLLPA